MEKEEVIKKVNELNGKELGDYIDSLLEENDKNIMGNKDVLLTIATRVNGFGYHHRVIRDRLAKLGLSMNDELERIEKEKTLMFLEGFRRKPWIF